ncbi:MAG: citrate/2-methylcitrate synthase [Nitrososphaerota archaeon]
MSYVPGLENIPAAETSISTIDTDAAKIWIRGYSLEELAKKTSYEEVAHLLIHGTLPTKEKLASFKETLLAESMVPKEVWHILKSLPMNMHPMDILRTAISALAGFDPQLEDTSLEANVNKAVRLVAKTGFLVGNLLNMDRGGAMLFSPDYGHAANILQAILGRQPKSWESRAFETAFILYVEHELAASTFASRVIASTMSDIYGAVAGAISALKGPLHGGANEKALEIFQYDVDGAERFVRERLAMRERIMGFGHRVYRRGIDPRAQLMKNVLAELCERYGDDRLYHVAVRVEEIMAAEKSLYPNLDFYVAPVYKLLGIPVRLFTPIFAASRMAGWCAHIIEQQAANRLFRPRAIYTGPKGLEI